MKNAVAALVLFLSLLLPDAGLAVDTQKLGELLEEAFGDEEQICAAIKTLDREISARPDDESLRKLRIAAYGSLADPYSAREDVDFLVSRHPDSPAFQLQKCLYAEATGATQAENRLCYLRVAECCRQVGEADAHSHEYLLALLLADAPEAEEAMRQFLAALGDSPLDRALKENLSHFSRNSLVRKIDPETIRHPCPRWQQPDEHEEK